MGTMGTMLTQLTVWPQTQKKQGDCNQGGKDPEEQQFRGSVGSVSDLQQNQLNAHFRGEDFF